MADIFGGKVRETVTFRRIVVVGGGCYGQWYTAQLARATARGALHVDDVVVVDRDADCRVATQLAAFAYGTLPVRLVVSEWLPFLGDWWSTRSPHVADPVDQRDALVPSPLMPHLILEWLEAELRSAHAGRTVRIEPLGEAPPVPWERAAPDGRHYVSFATWMCPINCIEPARCPETRASRDWSLPVTLTRFAQDTPSRVTHDLIFPCTHRTYGVGMTDVAPIVAARDTLVRAAALRPVRALVGSVSHCHGALGLLTIDAPRTAPAHAHTAPFTRS